MKTTRRNVLYAAAASVAGRLSLPAAASNYRVGVGVNTSGYTAAKRAIAASAEFPALRVAGKTVVIKPNLVAGATAETGITTDPEVVRAVVDVALAAGAASVVILETSANGAHFTACGYDFFRSYDNRNRITVVDSQTLPMVWQATPWGRNYTGIYIPQILTEDIVFISVGKLKTHAEGIVTLATKNLLGIPDITKYLSVPVGGRFEMHDRGLHSSICDLYLMRPIHYAVVDGIWAMEGNGPVFGTPVRMNAVLAGLNSIAVDRVGMNLMTIGANAVKYVTYLGNGGFGPTSMNLITVAGDGITPRAFNEITHNPSLDPPFLSAASFDPRAGESVTITQAYYEGVVRTCRVQILTDDPPSTTTVRTIAQPAFVRAGGERLVWNGRLDDGQFAAAGRYAISIQALSVVAAVRPAYVTSWVTVR